MINWKTTLLGVIAGAFPLMQQVVNALSAGGKVDWVQVGFGLAVIAMGVVAKDHNVTGAGPTAVVK